MTDAARQERLEELVARYVILRDSGATEPLDALCSEAGDLAEDLRRQVGELDRVLSGLQTLRDSAGDRQQLGRFALEGELGRGGMGIVYRARDTELDRAVALKVLAQGATRSRERFRREIQAISKLNHPGIVPIYEAGEEDGTLYYAMELVEGISLDQWSRQGRSARSGATTLEDRTLAGDDLWLSPDLEGPERERTCCRWVLQVARALEHAHAAGVTHRDIKPSNIMLTPDGRARLVDFGLAGLETGPRLTATGDLLGTPFYLSPEQIEGGALDARTDLYALGVTLYELLTGRVPFEAATREQLFQKILRDEPPAPRSLRPSLSRDAETICLQCLQKRPSQRYVDASALAEDLERLLDRRPLLARPIGPWTRAIRWTRRRPALTAAVALAAVLLGPVPIGFALYMHDANLDLQRETARANRFFREERQRAEEANRERQRAIASARNALAAIERMLVDVGFDRLAYVPQMEPVRRQLLQDALELYHGLLERTEPVAGLHSSILEARLKIAAIERQLGHPSEAARQLELALESIERLPPGSDRELMHGRLRSDLAETRLDQDRTEDAVRLERQALERYAAAGESGSLDEELRRLRAESELNLGNVYSRLERFEEAEPQYRAAIEDAETLDAAEVDSATVLAAARTNLGRALLRMGRHDEAENETDAGLALWEKLRELYPEWPTARENAARALINLGYLLHLSDRPAEGRARLEAAERIGRGLMSDFPSTPDYAEITLLATGHLGRLLLEEEQFEEAQKAFSSARTVGLDLLETHPDRARVLWRALGAGAGEAAALQALAEVDAARTLYAELTEITRPLVGRTSHAPAHSSYAKLLNNWAVLDLESKTSLSSVVTRLEEAIPHQELAVNAQPDSAIFRGYLWNHLGALSEALFLEERWLESARIAERMIAVYPESPVPYTTAARRIGDVVAALEKGESTETLDAWAKRCVEHLARAVALGADPSQVWVSKDYPARITQSPAWAK